MAYKLLCDEADIPCRIVHGRLGSSDHSWNLVQLSDGNWYHVDVSLDDEEGKTGYRFFGLTDEEMSLTHQWDVTKTPVCEGTHGRDALPQDETLLNHSRYEDTAVNLKPGIVPADSSDVDVESGPLPPEVPDGNGTDGSEETGTEEGTDPAPPSGEEPEESPAEGQKEGGAGAADVSNIQNNG